MIVHLDGPKVVAKARVTRVTLWAPHWCFASHRTWHRVRKRGPEVVVWAMAMAVVLSPYAYVHFLPSSTFFSGVVKILVFHQE